MVWQLVAMWAIVLATLGWFVRDERRLRHARLDAAARYYAQAPQYRYVPRNPAPIAPPRRKSGSLLRTDQAFFDRYLSERPRR